MAKDNILKGIILKKFRKIVKLITSMELLGNVRYHINISDILHRIMAMYKIKKKLVVICCVLVMHM